MRKCGVYETWKIPGVPEVEEAITATKMKTLGAVILIRSASRKFRIEYYHKADRAWCLLENHPVGSRGAVDNFLALAWFSSLKAARTRACELLTESRRRSWMIAELKERD